MTGVDSIRSTIGMIEEMYDEIVIDSPGTSPSTVAQMRRDISQLIGIVKGLLVVVDVACLQVPHPAAQPPEKK